MRAAIRRFHSPDVDDLESWSPPDPLCFGFLLQVLIGPEAGEGEESFDFIVCSPGWLAQRYSSEAVVFGRHHLLLPFGYDFGRVRKAIVKLVSGVSGESWRDIALKLARYGRWEFEDYAE
jgi:hypothetical protein